jgi:hypothetical protein
VPATYACLNRLLFLLRPLIVLKKQTRQAVCAVKQSILLRCLWQPLIEEQCLLKSVYSMMTVVQIISFLYKAETGKNRVGSKPERGRGKRIKRVGERA